MGDEGYPWAYLLYCDNLVQCQHIKGTALACHSDNLGPLSFGCQGRCRQKPAYFTKENATTVLSL